MEKAVLVQTVERTFNGLSDAEADEQCGANRYERRLERRRSYRRDARWGGPCWP